MTKLAAAVILGIMVAGCATAPKPFPRLCFPYPEPVINGVPQGYPASVVADLILPWPVYPGEGRTCY